MLRNEGGKAPLCAFAHVKLCLAGSGGIQYSDSFLICHNVYLNSKGGNYITGGSAPIVPLNESWASSVESFYNYIYAFHKSQINIFFENAPEK